MQLAAEGVGGGGASGAGRGSARARYPLVGGFDFADVAGGDHYGISYASNRSTAVRKFAFA